MHRQHAGPEIPDGLVLTQPWPAGPTDKRREQVIYYQHTRPGAAHAARDR